jgi:phosphopantothenate synthetase
MSEFRESINIFWRSINRKNKVQEKLKEVKDENGEILHENKQVVQR